MSEQPRAVTAELPDREEKLWARNGRIRLAELRADAKRPMGELLEAGIALSRIAGELAGDATPDALAPGAERVPMSAGNLPRIVDGRGPLSDEVIDCWQTL